MTDAKIYDLNDLLRVMQRLRDPLHGCPWDLQQDFLSIVPSTLEECYELVEAIEQADYPHLAEELGDLLFQVVFYAQLGSEREFFDFPTVVDQLVKKLIRRHPHVFADGELEGQVSSSTAVDEVNESWEQIKQGERAARKLHGLLADVPLALPALSRAQKLQKRAARVNFDWTGIEGVLDKLDEEIAEVREAIAAQRSDAIEHELGDLFFTCVNLARHAGLDSEACLRRASARFERRFTRMETSAREDARTLDNLSAEQLDDYWREAKALESQDK